MGRRLEVGGVVVVVVEEAGVVVEVEELEVGDVKMKRLGGMNRPVL